MLEENKITDDEIVSSFPKITLYLDNISVCEGCDGSVCNSPAEGMRSSLEVDAYGHIRVVYEDCPLAKINELSIKTIFLFLQSLYESPKVIISPLLFM